MLSVHSRAVSGSIVTLGLVACQSSPSRKASAAVTAHELVQRGYSDVRMIAERFDDLVSHNVSGLLAPVSMDTAVILKELREWLGTRVRFEHRTVGRFGDRKQTLVFGCAGLGSGRLNSGSEVVSVRATSSC